MSAQHAVQNTIRDILGFQVSALTRAELGPTGFEHLAPRFSAIQDLAMRLQAVNFDQVAEEIATQIQTHLQNIANQYNHIITFNPLSATDMRGQRQTITREIEDQYSRVVQPAAAAIVLSGPDVFAEAKNRFDANTAIVADAAKTAQLRLEELTRAVDAVRKAAQQTGVSRHATIFGEEAAKHQTQAATWLRTSTVLLGATLVYGAVLFARAAFYMPDLTTSQNVQLVLAKLLILSVLISASVAAARVYRAHLHNETVNKHRQNALSTFETFAQATTDDQTKGAVLLQATQCIFSPQHTGFISDESDGSTFPQVLEIVRSIRKD